jgi:hypothetical protein
VRAVDQHDHNVRRADEGGHTHPVEIVGAVKDLQTRVYYRAGGDDVRCGPNEIKSDGDGGRGGEKGIRVRAGEINSDGGALCGATRDNKVQGTIMERGDSQRTARAVLQYQQYLILHDRHSKQRADVGMHAPPHGMRGLVHMPGARLH